MSVALLGGCDQRQDPNFPPADVLRSHLVAVMEDTAAFVEPTMGRIVGRHYIPADDAWMIIACFEHGNADARAEMCEDSFRMLQLNNGIWIVSINFRGAYRWREVLREPPSM